MVFGSSRMTNVIRFPVERRARPTLELLREIAPDSRVVCLLVDELNLDCCPQAVRPAADRAMASNPLGRAQARRLHTGR